MKLILIRHASAEDRDPQRWPDDAQRPLTQRGMRRFRESAHGLATLEPEIDVLISSPFVRAHQTATILESEIGYPAPRLEPHLAAGSPTAGAVALLSREQRLHTVALVGHEPDLSLLLGALIGVGAAPAVDWRRGGAALVEFEQELRPAAGWLRWFITPRILRSLAD
jgi:phosphohistidine phosphatase